MVTSFVISAFLVHLLWKDNRLVYESYRYRSLAINIPNQTEKEESADNQSGQTKTTCRSQAPPIEMGPF
jgi:septin family protein